MPLSPTIVTSPQCSRWAQKSKGWQVAKATLSDLTNYLLTSGCSAVCRHRRHDIRHRPIHDLFLDGLH